MFGMKFVVCFSSRILVCLAVLLFLLQSVCFADNAEAKPDNYLVGMAVRRTFTGDYSIKLRFKNNTSNKYRLKENGNNSYTLFLPQVRSVISERDVYYENEHDDLKIVFSVKKDMVRPELFSTQINFKTKDPSFLRIQALAESSKVSDSEDIKKDNKSDKNSIPKGILFLLIAFGFACFSVSLLKKQSKKKAHFGKQTKNKSVYSDKTKIHKEPKKIKHINDEIQNDLTLMPGVPELPFLDQNDKSKNGVSEKEIDIYNPENISEKTISVVFPDKTSITERFKNRDLEKDINDLVFIERDSFLENISSINDIAMPTSKTNDEPQKDEDNIQLQYEELMSAFKNVLKIAHKISDDSLVPEVVDAFSISDTVGFCLVEYGEKTSLVGNIKDKVFLIRTFSSEEMGNDTLFMEFCTENENSQTYSVILNNFKALIKVTSSNISLIGDYTG